MFFVNKPKTIKPKNDRVQTKLSDFIGVTQTDKRWEQKITIGKIGIWKGYLENAG